MSCIFSIVGIDFEVDNFTAQSGIKPYKTFYKGELRLKIKPESKKYEYSGCSIEVSNAGFDEFTKQVNDAIEYLKLNQENLKRISSTTGIQFATLDFGVDYNNDKFTQTQYFPLNLLMLCADLGIGIELSIYQQTNA